MWGLGGQFLIAGPQPAGGTHDKKPMPSPQLFLMSCRSEVVRQMAEPHGLESTPELSVGPDTAKSLGC